jgi:hypothetical protein
VATILNLRSQLQLIYRYIVASTPDFYSSSVQVVCGSNSIGEVPELLSIEDEVILDVVSFNNHPEYEATLGPIEGFDLAIYKVDDTPLRGPGVVSRTAIWPACFPKKSYLEDEPGLLAGWRDPTPLYLGYNNEERNANGYRLKNLEMKQVRMEQMSKCRDPAWMEIPHGSYHPAGVLCAQDPSAASCLTFGNSGSGLMRPFAGHPPDAYRFSWVGSLSMYRGCDQATAVVTSAGGTREAHAGENPGIFTQASCHLAWVAGQYGMELGPELQVAAGQCAPATGRRNLMRVDCRTSLGTRCDFRANYSFAISKLKNITIEMDKCKLLGLEG